jgi:hypothetical protein
MNEGVENKAVEPPTLPIPFIDRRTLAKKAKDFKFPQLFIG